MRKIFLLIVPVLMLVSCNNKPASSETTAPTDNTTTTTTNEVPAPPITNDNSGAGLVPAQVWEEFKGPVSDASVTATLDGKPIATVTTNDSGLYAYKGLVKGNKYTFTVKKGTQTSSSQTIVYDGTNNSLPNFQLK